MQRRPTTQDVSWFLDQNRNKQLNLSPPYQRRSVWTMKDRRFFLDTVFRGYPCPAIFLHKRIEPDGRTTYDVVDGKQRLETLLMFADNKLSLGAGDTLDEWLRGKKWNDLGDDGRKRFWNYVLPVEQLDFNASETGAVNDAFDRLNRNSRKLEPQELRHARFDGWFIGLAEEEARHPVWQGFGVATSARARRMKDSQFISELLLVLVEQKQAGFGQEHLDDAYAKYDDPDDEGVELDTERVTTQLAQAKEFLFEMNTANKTPKSAASHVGAFYTLWSAVVLQRERLGPPVEFAFKYESFVKRAAYLREVSYRPQVAEPNDAHAEEYDKKLQGAHTDLAPREARLSSLLAATTVAPVAS